MYPFPGTADLQDLVGKLIVQVSLNAWSYTFNFDGGGYIHIEHTFEHIDEAGHTHPYGSDDRPAAIYLHQLIRHRIAAVQSEPFCLSITFENGALRIFSKIGPHECGQIQPSNYPGDMIIF
jgi:hypothetical protein